jgi:hypothetical protein
MYHSISAQQLSELTVIMSVCVFLPKLTGMQSASFLCRNVLSFVACLALPYLSALIKKQHDFGREKEKN